MFLCFRAASGDTTQGNCICHQIRRLSQVQLPDEHRCSSSRYSHHLWIGAPCLKSKLHSRACLDRRRTSMDFVCPTALQQIILTAGCPILENWSVIRVTLFVRESRESRHSTCAAVSVKTRLMCALPHVPPLCHSSCTTYGAARPFLFLWVLGWCFVAMSCSGVRLTAWNVWRRVELSRR